MDQNNPFNVYKGPDGLRKYFDPDQQPPLPLVELPRKLNPFYEDGVRIYAKMLTALPAQNVKALPALNMLLNDPSIANKTIVEASSGSTVTSLGITARVLYDNYDTVAYCTNKTELNRLRQLQFFGLKVELYGGPAQPEFDDTRGIIERVRRLARNNENVANPAQYDNENNWKSHLRWTGPQIWRQLPEVDIFCMGMGSTGCVTGTGMYLKSQKPTVKVVGVCNKEADPVPGPRALPLFDSCSFPWREVVDATEEISSVESYRMSMRLSREGLIAGPSSGMALQGLLKYLQRQKDADSLKSIADPVTGEISCIFVCCDLPHQYLDTYFQKLDKEEFHPMVNEDLLDIDQDVYDLKWEIDPTERHRRPPGVLNQIKKSVIVSDGPTANKSTFCAEIHPVVSFLDLRSHIDFASSHVQNALNLPLEGLSAKAKSPFDFEHTSVLHDQWIKLQSMFATDEVWAQILGLRGPLVVLCYNGDTSRIATAILRSKGIEAYSFMHGMDGLKDFLGEGAPGESRDLSEKGTGDVVNGSK